MPPCLPRRAFSFAEVLFAVIILGVGFIMIAAVFPVAIRQSKTTSEETTAAALARAAAGIVDQVAYYNASSNMLNMPATGGRVVSLSPASLTSNPITSPAWQAIKGSVIFQQDPRYGFVVLYRRNGTVGATVAADWASSAQIIIIGVQSQAASSFASNVDVVPTPPVGVAPKFCNLQPRLYGVVMTAAQGGSPGTVLFSQLATATYPEAPTPDPSQGIAEGSFIVIRDDQAANAAVAGYMNGRIYRVGARRPDLDNGGKIGFELTPDYDFAPDAGPDGLLAAPNNADNVSAIGTAATPALAWVVGRSFADPTNINNLNSFEGPAMDVSIYSTFVTVKQ